MGYYEAGRFCKWFIDAFMDKGLRTRLFAWWYFAIAAGFFLLATRAWLLEARLFQIILRLVISGGFLVLGLLTWRSRN